MQAPYFPDWRGVYHSEHLLGILCTSRNMFSGYIPALPSPMLTYSRCDSVIQMGKFLQIIFTIFIRNYNEFESYTTKITSTSP